MPGALKSFAGVKSFTIELHNDDDFVIKESESWVDRDYVQFPTSGADENRASAITGNKWDLEVAGSLMYNMRTDERASQISQQGSTIGVSTTQVPAFIEGEFYWHPTENVMNAGRDFEPQIFLEQQINVKVVAVNRGGQTITLENAHVTEVSDTDAITGTFTCRWEGTAAESVL